MKNKEQQFPLNDIRKLKCGIILDYDFSFCLNKNLFNLKPIQFNYYESYDNLPGLLSSWRKENPTISTGIFDITDERTKRWLDKYVLKNEDRIIFMIENEQKESFGHIGLTNFNLNDSSVELDSVLRGVKGVFPGLMSISVKKLIDFSLNYLKFKTVFLSVFSDNLSAVDFYNNLGFITINKQPLIEVIYPDEIKLEIRPKNSKAQIKKYYLKMKLING